MKDNEDEMPLEITSAELMDFAGIDIGDFENKKDLFTGKPEKKVSKSRYIIELHYQLRS